MNPHGGVPPLGVLLLAASGVLGLAAFIPFSMGVTRLSRDYRLAHDGATVEGRVDQLETFEYGGGGPPSASQRTETGIRVYYSFRAADNGTYHNTETPTSSEFVQGLKVGGPVRVRYVRSDPDVSEIESNPKIGYLFTAIGSVCLALMLVLFVTGLRRVLSDAGRGLTECTATVTELEEDVNYTVDSVSYVRVRFQFSDAAGNDHWGKSPPLPPAEARARPVGSRVRIRYEPSDPSITRWLG